MVKRVNLTLNEEYQGYIEKLSEDTGITDYPVLIRLAIKRSFSLTFGAVPKALPVVPKAPPEVLRPPRLKETTVNDITPVSTLKKSSSMEQAFIDRADGKI